MWIKNKYWHKEGNQKWVFKTKESSLYNIASTKIVRHIKIKSKHHVFDGQEEYWNKRRTMNRTTKTRIDLGMEKQKFRCNVCKGLFKHDSVIELDHIIPQVGGGTDKADSRQVLHRHCHDTKTRTDGSLDQRQHTKKKGLIAKDIKAIHALSVT